MVLFYGCCKKNQSKELHFVCFSCPDYHKIQDVEATDWKDCFDKLVQYEIEATHPISELSGSEALKYFTSTCFFNTPDGCAYLSAFDAPVAEDAEFNAVCSNNIRQLDLRVKVPVKQAFPFPKEFSKIQALRFNLEPPFEDIDNLSLACFPNLVSLSLNTMSLNSFKESWRKLCTQDKLLNLDLVLNHDGDEKSESTYIDLSDLSAHPSLSYMRLVLPENTEVKGLDKFVLNKQLSSKIGHFTFCSSWTNSTLSANERAKRNEIKKVNELNAKQSWRQRRHSDLFYDGSQTVENLEIKIFKEWNYTFINHAERPICILRLPSRASEVKFEGNFDFSFIEKSENIHSLDLTSNNVEADYLSGFDITRFPNLENLFLTIDFAKITRFDFSRLIYPEDLWNINLTLTNCIIDNQDRAQILVEKDVDYMHVHFSQTFK